MSVVNLSHNARAVIITAALEVEAWAEEIERGHTVGGSGQWDGSEPEAEAECIRLRALAVRLRFIANPDSVRTVGAI